MEVSAAEPEVMITGAGGFVGGHLIAELERETQWEIIGLERRPSSARGRVRMLVCDLQDRGLVERTVARYRPDYIVHLAAQSYVPQALASPADTIVNNSVSQINLSEACRSAGINPVFLVIGSAEVYGFAGPEEMPLDENQPFRPGNPYAVSKITQDMLGYQYFKTYGMKMVRLRPFNHFGPGQSDRFVLSSFARQIAQAERGRIEPTVLTGDLSSERDFCDVRDVVRGYRLALDHALPGEAYNIGSGVARPVGSLLNMLIGMAEIPIEIRRDPARMRPSDVQVLVGDARKFQGATGWEPRIPIEDSLLDILNYWRAELRSPDD
ncbi:GDP-mannose 4,6-dehydratase [soil metagenome]